MNKNIFKFLSMGLLLIAILAVPIFGVHFYDFGYNSDDKEWFTDWTTILPGLTTENSILTNMKFGGGTSVYLAFDSEDEKINSDENLKKGAEILEARFQERGYSDAKTEVVDGLIRLDFSQKTYLDTVIAQIASIGEWSFVGSDMNTALCDASMVEGAEVTAHSQGGFAVTLKLNEKGQSDFFANTASYAVSGSYFYLMLDGQFAGQANVSPDAKGDTFTFGQFQYEDAAALASIIDHGELPANVTIEKTEELAPSLGGLLTVIYIVIALIAIAAFILLLLKGKSAGFFAIAALIADVALYFIAMLNASFQLNFVTLIAMVVFFCLGAALYLFALTPISKSFKEQNSISFSAVAKLGKISFKALWIHVAVAATALICYLFATGSFLYVVKIALLFACANLAFYFIFFYFGVRSLVSKNK